MSTAQFSSHLQEEDQEQHLFEKTLTPSDVGKLNRLVIPKQHAEKYFPIGGDSLLSFEDESGKSWRFRYSYWNSSQSYVLTKGWSRFVKEKRLDAGDIVMFRRRHTMVGEEEHLFISWRRRHSTSTTVQDSEMAQVVPNSSTWTQAYYNAQYPYTTHPHQHHLPMFYQPPCLHAVEPVVETPTRMTTPVNSKRLRLFGVNLDCQIDESDDQPMNHSSPSMSSQGRTHIAYMEGHGLNHNSYY